MVGIERKKRVEIEVGTADIKRRKDQLSPGWEWVWMEDPWTGTWERLRVPKEEADYRKERNPSRTLLLGRSRSQRVEEKAKRRKRK